MKKYLLLLLMFMVSWMPANAQVTIPETVISSKIGTTQSLISYDFSTLGNNFQPILDANGPNQTWDISGFTVTDTFEFVQEYLPASSDIPGSDLPEFSGADFVIKSEEDFDGQMFQGYNHQTLQNGELRSLGTTVVGDMDMDGIDDQFHTFLDPNELMEVFPIQFGNTFSDSTATTFSTAPGTVISIEESEHEVDGWGTLITSYGTFDALRYTTTLIYTDPFTMIPTLTTFVEFVTQEGVVASISSDASGVFGAVLSMFGDMIGTDTEPADSGLPAEFKLSQNFPNPFNPSTRITYSIPESSDVRLTVYGITGKEVATLVSGTRAAGTYEVTFDASNLASGVYLYRLQTNGLVETRVMNLIK